jgi:hypothetical protein
MNLQEDIQRIKQVMNINESSGEKLIKYVYDNGTISTAKLVGGYDDLLKLLGNYTIPKEALIKDIKWFLNEELNDVGGDFDFEVYDQPKIFYKLVYNEYHEIVHLKDTGVAIDVYNGVNFEDLVDEYMVPYNELPYKTLLDIVEMIVELLANNF